MSHAQSNSNSNSYSNTFSSSDSHSGGDSDKLVIYTVAGETAAQLYDDEYSRSLSVITQLRGVHWDSVAKEAYFVDGGDCQVRRVELAGPRITNFAGNGICASASLNNVAATSLSLNAPYDVWGDSAGDVYLTSRFVVYKISKDGVARLLAGDPNTFHFGFQGNNGPATSATIMFPTAVVGDTAGNIFISDVFDRIVLRVSAATNIISVIAGTSTTDSFVTSLSLSVPESLAVDLSGMLYIGDTGTNLVHKLKVNGLGNFVVAETINTTNYSPHGMCVDGQGDLYLADGNKFILKMSPANGVSFTVVAGDSKKEFNESSTFFDGSQLAYSAQLKPIALSCSPDTVIGNTTGVLVLGDSQNLNVHIIESSLSTVSDGRNSGLVIVLVPVVVAVSVLTLLVILFWYRCRASVNKQDDQEKEVLVKAINRSSSHNFVEEAAYDDACLMKNTTFASSHTSITTIPVEVDPTSDDLYGSFVAIYGGDSFRCSTRSTDLEAGNSYDIMINQHAEEFESLWPHHRRIQSSNSAFSSGEISLGASARTQNELPGKLDTVSIPISHQASMKADDETCSSSVECLPKKHQLFPESESECVSTHDKFLGREPTLKSPSNLDVKKVRHIRNRSIHSFDGINCFNSNDV